MLSVERLDALNDELDYVFDSGLEGDLVECGVWRGGAAFLMANRLRSQRNTGRKIWLLDSFEGLPSPTSLDGSSALNWAAEKTAPNYHDNCKASLSEVKATAAELGLTDYTAFVPGWFEDTLPQFSASVEKIALLRIDCDWYLSVKCVLSQLYDRVVIGGVIIIDDYSDWEGCTRAVHEFLAERSIVKPLSVHNGEAHLRKIVSRFAKIVSRITLEMGIVG